MKTPTATFDDVKNNMDSMLVAMKGLAASGKSIDELEEFASAASRSLARQALEAAVNEAAKKKMSQS